MEWVITIIVAAVAVWVWRRVRNVGWYLKTRKSRYTQHLMQCDLCFKDGGPYPFEPCPLGLEIMVEEMKLKDQGRR